MNKITLYPSNWLYNAGVVGFLRVVEFEGDIGKVDLLPSGEVVIEREIIEKSYEYLFDYHIKVLNEDFKIWGKNKRYPNYIQSSQREFFENYYIKELKNVVPQNNKKQCNWCKGYFLPSEKIDYLKENFKGDFAKFMEQREKFQGIHIKELGAAITEMPNAFWNFDFSIPICHFCSYLIIFHHLAFIIVFEEEIFINSPNFQLTWDLNKFAEDILKREKQYSVRKLLGSSLLEWAIKRRTLLGAWTMMNIEVITKKWNKEERKWIIDYFDLPYHITRILLDPDVASLIKEINEEKIFDLIVRSKFSELEKANYFVLRALLKLKNNQRISDNDPVTKYVAIDERFRRNRQIDTERLLKHLQSISTILPELYAKILRILKQI